MEKLNKHWRIEQRNRIYIVKMKLFAAYSDKKIINGEPSINARWIDLYRANWNCVYKSVRTPCSCWLCRGQRYDRGRYKSTTRRILNEVL